MRFRLYVIIYLIFLFCGCRYDKFDTEINIKLVSGINILKVNPCKVIIVWNKVQNGIAEGGAVIDTIITDSFGNAQKFVKLSKLKKNQYYSAILLESKWQYPWDSERRVIPEIKNTFGYGVKPKWRRTITLEDSIGKYHLDQYECYNSTSLYYRDYQKYDTLKKFNQQFLFASAPSYSHIFINLTVHNRSTKEKKIFKYVFDSEKFYDIWIKY